MAYTQEPQTELMRLLINPTILDASKTPLSKIMLSGHISFNIERGNRVFSINFYNDKDGQVSIWGTDKYGMISHTILQDYCKTLSDFERLIATFDDLITRFPQINP